jgi:CMP-N-acetylneuraminic acid synthetase
MEAGKPRLLAVVPARGGSKRLPEKNIRPLAGKPLIAWTIEVARASGVFVDVLVTTDSQDIATTAAGFGAHVPWLRPAELATDTATSLDVLVHAVQRYLDDSGQALDGVMLLQPTSPFRRPGTICRAVERFVATGGQSVVAVSPPATHPYWCLVLDENEGLQPFASDRGLTMNSQSLPTVYAVNGVLYLVSVDQLLRHGSLYTSPFWPEIIEDPVECLDIDTPFDWAIAESFSTQLKELSS